MVARLAEQGLGIEWLTFEISERLLMTDPKPSLFTLSSLKRIGAWVTVEGFGADDPPLS